MGKDRFFCRIGVRVVSIFVITLMISACWSSSKDDSRPKSDSSRAEIQKIGAMELIGLLQNDFAQVIDLRTDAESSILPQMVRAIQPVPGKSIDLKQLSSDKTIVLLGEKDSAVVKSEAKRLRDAGFRVQIFNEFEQFRQLVQSASSGKSPQRGQ